MVSPGGGPVTAAAGVTVLTAPLPTAGLGGSTLIIAGGCGMEDGSSPALTPDIVRWVADAGGGADAVARCCSVCTGAFLLARTGLLDGRRAVTHWQDAAQLQAQFPAITVQEDAIHIKDGTIYSLSLIHI